MDRLAHYYMWWTASFFEDFEIHVYVRHLKYMYCGFMSAHL